jgi:hypothetical protein
MDPQIRRDICYAIGATYTACAYDVWDGQTPDDDEFVDVVSDLLADFWDGDDIARDVWRGLSHDDRRALILTVGP